MTGVMGCHVFLYTCLSVCQHSTAGTQAFPVALPCQNNKTSASNKSHISSLTSSHRLFCDEIFLECFYNSDALNMLPSVITVSIIQCTGHCASFEQVSVVLMTISLTLLV